MEMSSVLKFLENKSILVTGGAGFLAKIFAEKVLRCQPNVKKVYLLIRAADKKSASLRLQNEVIGKALFKVLKQKMGSNFNSFISEKIKVVPGDITCEDLGIKESNIKEEILKEVDVIVNLAATTNFDERYDVSLYLNTFGAKYVLDFAKKCTNLKNLLHVSTAYVSGEMGGLVKESPYSMGESLNGRPGLNIEFEKTLIDKKLLELQAVGATNEIIKHTMRDMGLERAKQWGWPNVYVFTKALGEMLIIQEKGDIPLVIVRPTIVTSTFKEPFPGWVEGVRTIDSLAVAYGKGRLPCFVGDPDSVVDVIPADMVCNAMLVAAMIHANEKGNPRIYQVGSSVKNPTTFSNLHEVAYQYFQRYPWINKDNGKPIRVGHVRVLGSMDSFNRYLTLYYLLPLKALELANIALCQSFRGTFLEQTRKINYVKRLIDIYKPYLFFKGIYDDSNTEKLREAARNRGVETDIFYFDPKAVHWEDYFMNTHLPGLVKYVFK